jgi:hypothetical protein
MCTRHFRRVRRDRVLPGLPEFWLQHADIMP